MKKLLLTISLLSPIWYGVAQGQVTPQTITPKGSGVIGPASSVDSLFRIIAAAGDDSVLIGARWIKVDSLIQIIKILGQGSVTELRNIGNYIGDPSVATFPVVRLNNSAGSAFLRYNSTSDVLQWSVDSSSWNNFGTGGGGADSATVRTYKFYNNDSTATDSLDIGRFPVWGKDTTLKFFSDAKITPRQVMLGLTRRDTLGYTIIYSDSSGLCVFDSIALSSGGTSALSYSNGARIYFGNSTVVYLDSVRFESLLVAMRTKFVKVSGDSMGGNLDMRGHNIEGVTALTGAFGTASMDILPGAVGGDIYFNRTYGGNMHYAPGSSNMVSFKSPIDSATYMDFYDTTKIINLQSLEVDTISFANGGAYIRYNGTVDSLQWSKDGSSWIDFGAGGGGGSGDDAYADLDSAVADGAVNLSTPFVILEGAGAKFTLIDATVDTLKVGNYGPQPPSGGSTADTLVVRSSTEEMLNIRGLSSANRDTTFLTAGANTFLKLGDRVSISGSVFVLPISSAPSNTAVEGEIEWDTDDNILMISNSTTANTHDSIAPMEKVNTAAGDVTYDMSNFQLNIGTGKVTSVKILDDAVSMADDMNTFTSLELLTQLTNETGTGAAVFGTTPTLTTPVLGVATATSVNKVAITAPATASTLTIADGATLTVNGSATITNGTHSGTNTGDQTNITGNAATVTTNANLTGPVTSTGNATAITAATSATWAAVITDEVGTGRIRYSDTEYVYPMSVAVVDTPLTSKWISLGGLDNSTNVEAYLWNDSSSTADNKSGRVAVSFGLPRSCTAVDSVRLTFKTSSATTTTSCMDSAVISYNGTRKGTLFTSAKAAGGATVVDSGWAVSANSADFDAPGRALVTFFTNLDASQFLKVYNIYLKARVF